ncbi:MAG: YgjV family protein [Bacilli bacterium]|nr:YgjV family protein [Bacilli bacterium]
MNVVAQLFGFIALTFLMFSIQSNKKLTVLFLQVIANAFFGLQYIILKTFSAVLMNFVAIFRSIIYYMYEKKNKRAPKTVILLLFLLIIVFSVTSFNGLISLLPIAATMLYTYGTWQADMKTYRIVVIAGAIFWLIFNINVGAYVSVISSILELISGIIAVCRYDLKKNIS